MATHSLGNTTAEVQSKGLTRGAPCDWELPQAGSVIRCQCSPGSGLPPAAGGWAAASLAEEGKGLAQGHRASKETTAGCSLELREGLVSWT